MPTAAAIATRTAGRGSSSQSIANPSQNPTPMTIATAASPSARLYSRTNSRSRETFFATGRGISKGDAIADINWSALTNKFKYD
jgi:hypothetical protein